MTKKKEEFLKRYQNLMKERRALYDTLKRCHCPLLGVEVVLNARGFYHFKRDGQNHPRTKKEQMYRMGLVPLIIPVIKNATKIHDYRHFYSKREERYVQDWKLQEVVGKRKTTVTVILRKIGNGRIAFHSVFKKPEKRITTKKPSKR